MQRLEINGAGARVGWGALAHRLMTLRDTNITLLLPLIKKMVRMRTRSKETIFICITG